MQSIALPKKIEFVAGQEPNQGLIIVEPCYPGYGTSLGNSLRRVLLSSLEGAAVIGVKIKGTDHEFTSIPHVKEDALEVILNLKQLKLKVHSDEVVKLEIDVHGEKVVTAGDIVKNSQVEISNPDLEIAHITDMAGKLNMEISVSCGRGYETIESREGKKNEIGYIEMDSIFSPVLSVGINVDNVRVGKMTNWDKLILDITTDGSITPETAFQEATKILIQQFKSLLTLNQEEEKEEVAVKEEVKEIEEVVVREQEVETAAKEEVDVDDEGKKKRGRPKKS